MSLPKKGVITKICSISLFVFLMLFNVKVAFSDKSSGDIDILGMKISVSVPSAYASGGQVICDNTLNPDWTCTWTQEGNCCPEVIIEWPPY